MTISHQDGLREGPIDHGPISNESDWLDAAAPIIEQRMAKYQVRWCYVTYNSGYKTVVRIYNFKAVIMGFMMLEGTPDGENILKAVEKGSEPSA